jgi:hypothetical protein
MVDKDKIKTMYKLPTQSHRKIYFLASIGLIVILGAYLATAKLTNFWPFHDKPTSLAISDPNAAPSPKTATPSPKNNNVSAKDSTAQPSDKVSSDIPVSTGFAAKINDLSQNGQTIHFAASVSNSPQPGMCVITFTNPNDRPVTKQFDATVKGTDAACSTDVSAYEFSYLGDWQVSFHYYIGNQQATAEGSINIK